VVFYRLCGSSVPELAGEETAPVLASHQHRLAVRRYAVQHLVGVEPPARQLRCFEGSQVPGLHHSLLGDADVDH